MPRNQPAWVPAEYLTVAEDFGWPVATGVIWSLPAEDSRGIHLHDCVIQHVVATFLRRFLLTLPHPRDQKQLAEALAVSRAGMSFYLNGKRPMPDTLVQTLNGLCSEKQANAINREIVDEAAQAWRQTGLLTDRLPPSSNVMGLGTVTLDRPGRQASSMDDETELHRIAEPLLRQAALTARQRLWPDAVPPDEPEIVFETDYRSENIWARVWGHIFDDEPDVYLEVQLDGAWLGEVHAPGLAVIDGHFVFSVLDVDENGRPSVVVAIRALPETLLPVPEGVDVPERDTGDDWRFILDPADIVRTGDQATGLKWIDDFIYQAADGHGVRAGHPPVRNPYEWGTNNDE